MGNRLRFAVATVVALAGLSAGIVFWQGAFEARKQLATAVAGLDRSLERLASIEADRSRLLEHLAAIESGSFPACSGEACPIPEARP